MPAVLGQWGIGPATTSSATAVVSPSVNLPVGTFVVLGMSFNVGAGATSTIVDSGGNSWAKTQGRTSAGGEDTLMATCLLTNALTTASTITVTLSLGMTRHSVACVAFSDVVSGAATLGAWGETSSALAVTGGTVTPSVPSLVVAVTGFVSSGREFTPAAGWTEGNKYISTAGSGNRAVQCVWLSTMGAAATPYATIGTLDTGGVMYTALGHVASGAPVSPGYVLGRPKVWTGSTWALKPAKIWNGTSWVDKTSGVKVSV